MATLDVLIPHFNDPDGFKVSLDSIVAQDWTGSLRVVTVDDGSTDAACAAVEAHLAAADVETVLLKNDGNRGRPYTRNRLLDQVEAPYLAWLDSGDSWYPEKLALQFDELHRLMFNGHPIDRAWITCDYHWCWANMKPRHNRQAVDQDQLKALLMGGTLRGYLWTILAPSESFRRVGRFDERLPRLQDVDFFLRFVEAGGFLANPTHSKPLCRYEKSDIGRDGKQVLKCMHLVLEKHRRSIEKYGPGFMRMRRHHAALHAARFSMNNQAWAEMAQLIALSAWEHPRLAARKLVQGKLTP